MRILTPILRNLDCHWKKVATLKCNPYITKDYSLYPTNNHIIHCPVTGMNHHKYDTKCHRDTERKTTADQDDQVLSNNANDSSLDRTDLSALINIDLGINFLNSNMAYSNTRYFDDQYVRDKFKSNKNIAMVHLIIRSIPEHFYSIEKNIRVNKRAGDVSLYVHSSLQYKLRNDFKIGSDTETITSVFVEIDKNTPGTRRNLIIGRICRPPWVNLSE